MAKIFLSYASEDRVQVRAIYDRLRAVGHQPWMDEPDLLPGQRWQQEIPKALRNADFILIFFSRHSVPKKGYIQREFKLALDTLQETPENVIHTVPVRLEACTIPEQFGFLQWCNLFEEDGFERLMQAIQAGLSQRQPPESGGLMPERVETASPLFPEQQVDPLSSPIEALHSENKEPFQEDEIPASHFPQRVTSQQHTPVPAHHKIKQMYGALQEKLPHIKKYIFFCVGMSMLISLLLIVRAGLFLHPNNRSPHVRGVYVRIAVKGGEKITSDMIEMQGDPTRIPPGQPIVKEHVIGFCAVKALPQGTRLTLDNVGSCLP